MAVDSHEDNQYELTIDSVNNNCKKSSLQSIKLESRDEDDVDDDCYISYTDASQICYGSARRKYNAISKGISIEEFLLAQERCGQLTAIDKLILKNKAALATQMKQTRSKIIPAKEPNPTAKVKKESKPRKEKVIGSKIAAKKKCAPVVETKPIKAAVTKKMKNGKNTIAKGEEMRKIETKPKREPPKNKKTSKVEPINNRKRKTADDVGKSVIKVKKMNKNGRQTDLNSFKPNASHKTRSFTKVKLRNGKSRIIQEKKPAPTAPRRYSRRSITSLNSSEVILNGKTPTLKRSIKEEPLDDDVGMRRKRRRTAKLQTPESPVPVTPSVVADIDMTPAEIAQPVIETVTSEKTPAEIKEELSMIDPEIIEISDQDETEEGKQIVTESPKQETKALKQEDIESLKQDVESLKQEDTKSTEPDAEVPKETNIEEINVVNTDQYPTEKPASPFVLQDLSSYVKEIAKQTKPDTMELAQEIEEVSNESSEDTECEEFSLQEANTETEDIDEDITLQLESDEGDCTDKDNNNEPPQTHPTESKSQVQEVPLPKPSEPETSQEKHRQPDTQIVEKPENNAVKESILGALGLQSLEKVAQKAKDKDTYTGTLKAVIKIDKGCRRMELKQKESHANIEGLQNENVLSFYSKIIQNKLDTGSDGGTVTRKVNDTEMSIVNGDTYKGAKPHDDGLLSSLREANGRNMETEYNVIGDQISNQLALEKTKTAASLVVPEKSSSFSVHPNRLCSDVCKYCFGKFGTLDTPCHVGQMKNPERQRKILQCEPNLKPDTCLCDACYRYVDRKANKPPQKRNKNMRRTHPMNQRTVCVIQNCNQFARHTVKRKWLLRISKKIAKLSYDVNKGGPRMRYGLCSQHYYLVDYYTLCGICKKRLNRNHMYSIRSELNDLNGILKEDSIPITLMDNMLLCKLCHYYMSLRLKYGTASNMSPSNRQYYKNFRNKILIYYNVMVSDNEDVIGSESGVKYVNGDACNAERISGVKSEDPPKESIGEAKRNSGSTSKKNHNVGIQDIADLLKPLEGADGDKNSTRIQVKFGNLNIGKLSNLNIGQNTQTEVKHDKSGDKDVPLIADFRFETPQAGQKNWEKCVSTILFDKGTKKLWQDLQKPYGNQSSFIRHLIMLEKYWRSGALVLSEGADGGAVKYINSVKNRIQSLETSSTPNKLPTLKPATETAAVHFEGVKSSVEGVIRHTPQPPPLLKIDQMNGLPFGVPKMASEPKSVPVRNADISLSQYTEMMHPQPRTKHLTQISNGTVKGMGVSLLKKPLPTMPTMKPIHISNSSYATTTQKTARKSSASRLPPPRLTAITTLPPKQDNSSLIISKLPKALTVTQIDEPMREKMDDKPQLIPAPFLAGEKPSVTVFREVSK